MRSTAARLAVHMRSTTRVSPRTRYNCNSAGTIHGTTVLATVLDAVLPSGFISAPSEASSGTW
eukprot:1060786-Rhodomonas_salina.1